MTQPHYMQHSQLVRDQKHNGAVIAIAWVIAVLTLGYMIPWAVAATRGKTNHGAIGLLNFLLGWTLIGWVVALVMACGAHAAGMTTVATSFPGVPQQPQPGSAPAAGWYPSPDGSGTQAYWNGQAWEQGQTPPSPA